MFTATSIAAWQAQCRAQFGALTIHAGGGPFRATMRGRSFGFAQVARLSGSAQQMVRRVERDALFATWKVLVQLAGTCVVRDAEHAVSLAPGEFVALDGRAAYSLDVDAGFEQALVIFPRERVPADLVRASMSRSSDDALDRLVAAHLVSLSTLSDASERDPRLASATLGLLEASSLRPGTEEPRAIRRVKQVIEAELHDPALDVGSIIEAAAVGSRRTVESCFARHGLTVAGVLWRARLDRAARLLDDPGQLRRSIGEIAFSCGFRDGAHFARAFRRATGESPSARRGQTIRATASARVVASGAKLGSP